jgi:hypothetical protein
VRKPGRSDVGDARPDRIDVPPAAEAGDVGVPAGGETAVVRAPDQDPHLASPPASTGTADPVEGFDAAATDTTTTRPEESDAAASDAEADVESPAAETDDLPADDLPADHLVVVPDFPGDDLLIDPLLSDEPIDLAAVRADDALIDFLGGGDLDAAHDLIDVDDPLIAMLAAWAASARPHAEPEPERGRPSLTLVSTPDDVAGETAGTETAGGEAPHRSAEAEPPDEVDAPLVAVERAADAPAALVEVAGARSDGPADAAADDPAEEDGATAAAAAADPAADTGAVAATARGPVRRLVPPPVLGVLDRARITRRRTTPQGHPLPAGHPLRRAAVAVVVAALGVSAAAAAGGTARPGDPGFAMTRVFFSERAESLEAAQVVAEGLERANAYIAERQPALAAQELAAVENRLPDVRDSEGHTLLVDQQQKLAAAVALTPPAPPDASRTDTPTGPSTARTDPDTSILAEPAPATSSSDASTPDAATSGDANVVTAPSGNAASGGAPPEKGSAAQEGPVTAGTPPKASTSTVSGATDQGTVTADPTPTTGASGSGDATTTVTTTSEPTDPTTTTSTSSTAEPTSSASTSTPPPSTTAPSGGEGTVATGSVPADGASIVVRPAAHHAPVGEPGAVVPEPVAHSAPVVVTTVPSPVRGDGAGARPAGVGDIHPRTLAESRISRAR